MSAEYISIAEECRRRELSRLDAEFAAAVAQILFDNKSYEKDRHDPHTEVVDLDGINPVDWLAKALPADDATRLRSRYLLCDSPEKATRGIALWAFTNVADNGGPD